MSCTLPIVCYDGRQFDTTYCIVIDYVFKDLCCCLIWRLAATTCICIFMCKLMVIHNELYYIGLFEQRSDCVLFGSRFCLWVVFCEG
jgi:hypothetical protein